MGGPHRWQCCECSADIDPSCALPRVVGGKVLLRCAVCPAPVPVTAIEPPPISLRSHTLRRRSRGVVAAGFAAATAVFLLSAAPNWLSVSKRAAATSTLAIAGTDSEPIEPPAPRAVRRVTVGPASWHEVDLGRIVDDSELFDWVHPVTGAEEKSPHAVTRQFGADRPGDRPEECGHGHCGVDLDGPRGTPVVAVDAGVIDGIQRDDVARGGRYVRIRHDGGLITSYMHLDDVPENLNVGDTVDRGTWLGSLGASGIKNSEPHLHFSASLPEEDGTLRYIDPAPSLDAAEVIDSLAMTVSD